MQIYELGLELQEVKDDRDTLSGQLEDMGVQIAGLHGDLAELQHDFHALHQLQVQQVEQQAPPVPEEGPEEVQGDSDIDYEDVQLEDMEEVRSDSDGASD